MNTQTKPVSRNALIFRQVYVLEKYLFAHIAELTHVSTIEFLEVNATRTGNTPKARYTNRTQRQITL